MPFVRRCRITQPLVFCIQITDHDIDRGHGRVLIWPFTVTSSNKGSDGFVNAVCLCFRLGQETEQRKV